MAQAGLSLPDGESGEITAGAVAHAIGQASSWPTDDFARWLTTPWKGNVVSRANESPWPDKLRRLAQVRTRLQRHAGDLKHQVARDPRAHLLIRAVRTDDDVELARLGVDVTYAWLDDVALALVAADPIVYIETVGPYAAHHLDPSGQLDVSAQNLTRDEMAGLLLASILRDAFTDCTNLRQRILVDDLNDDLNGTTIPESQRRDFVVDMSRILLDLGALKSSDVAGTHFMVMQESANQGRCTQLVERLRDSAHGIVELTDDGDLVFRPTERAIRQLALKSRSRVREFSRRGIAIKRMGRYTCQALDAAGYLHAEDLNRSGIHVVMLDKRFGSQQDKTYALLRALGIVRQETHHNVLYDTDLLSPELITLTVCELLLKELARLDESLRRYTDWDAFDSNRYHLMRYGSRRTCSEMTAA
ncbi:MAG TPA: hypothetical protein VIP77_00915 [Jiangellaceae bacterium]